jgi:hypothetical protein
MPIIDITFHKAKRNKSFDDYSKQSRFQRSNNNDQLLTHKLQQNAKKLILLTVVDIFPILLDLHDTLSSFVIGSKKLDTDEKQNC